MGDLDFHRQFGPFHLQRMERQGHPHHHHVAVDRVRPRLLQAHLGERQVELFGHQHRQRRVHALAHFSPRHGQHDAAVLRDFDPAVQRHFARRCWQHVFGLAQARTHRHHAPADDERASSTQAAQ